MCIFSILCDAMESMHKPHLLDTENWWLSWEVLILQFELWPILTYFSFFFFNGASFFLKKQLTWVLGKDFLENEDSMIVT